jgi:hypothetical protein
VTRKAERIVRITNILRGVFTPTNFKKKSTIQKYNYSPSLIYIEKGLVSFGPAREGNSIIACIEKGPIILGCENLFSYELGKGLKIKAESQIEAYTAPMQQVLSKINKLGNLEKEKILIDMAEEATELANSMLSYLHLKENSTPIADRLLSALELFNEKGISKHTEEGYAVPLGVKAMSGLLGVSECTGKRTTYSLRKSKKISYANSTYVVMK